MKLEELSDLEIKQIEMDIARRLLPAKRGATGGIATKDYIDVNSYNASTDIIKNFRTLGLSSYRKGAYDSEIPEFMRPFVDRTTLAPGEEVVYHNSRMAYIRSILKQVKKDPRTLKSMERVAAGFFVKHIFNFPDNDSELTNAALHYRQLENNIGNIYALFCLEEFGPGTYVIGIDENGGVSTRKYGKGNDMTKELNTYQDIHAHANVFMAVDSSTSERLILDGFRWATGFNRLEKLSTPNAGLVGFELLSSGIENKEFHSSRPHEIILDKDNIHSITVVDNPPNSIGFLTRFMDGTTSMGYMSARDNVNGGIVALNSDYAANFTINNRLVSKESNSLFDLAGAIARDMFVCVQRDKYYTRGNGGGNSRTRNNQDRIIWLPRFRVNLRRDGGNDHGDVLEKIVTLSPCHVSGHKRICNNPSQRQLDIARSLGINLPNGYTYVKEYDRGEIEQRRLYKSRSAMSVLFEAS